MAPVPIQSDDTPVPPPASAAPSPEPTETHALTAEHLAGAQALATHLPRPPVPPPCRFADDVTRPGTDDDWTLAVVDTALRLPPDYAPSDQVPTAAAGIDGGGKVRKGVIADLRAMAAQAGADGIPLRIRSAYRSEPRQADVFEGWARQVGRKKALRVSARAGHSEHQLGTTIDVATEGETDVDSSWGATPHGQWVATNAHKYGFLLSYPPDASDRTCYDYEPWHLRYVGRELAADVIDSGLSLREYLWQLNPVDITTTTTTTRETTTTTRETTTTTAG